MPFIFRVGVRKPIAAVYFSASTGSNKLKSDSHTLGRLRPILAISDRCRFVFWAFDLGWLERIYLEYALIEKQWFCFYMPEFCVRCVSQQHAKELFFPDRALFLSIPQRCLCAKCALHPDQ